MKLYSYVVARDYGFAPNPFFGFCTLATCKPEIRKSASCGDWIVGTGSKLYGLEGNLVYAMTVLESLTYDEYWNDVRFRAKRPNLKGSLKQAFGDNIYHHDSKSGKWLQEDSHHSLPSGQPNRANIKHDTQVPKSLIATEFVYFGGLAPKIPKQFRGQDGDVCKRGPGHKCNFSDQFVRSFVSWINSLSQKGYAGRPREFDS